MYTASIVEKKQERNNVKVIVEFNNGTDSFTQEFVFSVFSMEMLKTNAKQVLDQLNSIDLSSIPTGPLDVTQTTVVLTQAQIDQTQFMKDYLVWIQVKRGIDVGILTGNETQVVALKSKVQSEFKPAYLNLL